MTGNSGKIKNFIKSKWLIIPGKIDKGNDGNIMPIYTLKFFPRAMLEQLVQTNNKRTVLKAYNKATIRHMYSKN